MGPPTAALEALAGKVALGHHGAVRCAQRDGNRLLLLTDLQAMAPRAAGLKRTATGQLRQAGRRAGDRRQRPALEAVGAGNGPQQRLGIWMRRPVEDVLHAGALDEPA